MTQIKACSVFAAQATILRNELAGEQKWLESAQFQDGPYGPFARNLHGDIQQTMANLDDLIPKSNTATLPQSRFASLRARATNLFSEVLALRSVEFIRANNLDNGMCLIGDKLLAELGKAVRLEVPHLTTVAESEFFGSPSRVIRLRYPAISTWDLPVLAHEFGHSFGPLWYVERALKQHPHEIFLNSGELGSRRVADEYFCDLLATFLLGPAYPSMCVLLRFDPTNGTDSETHPADTKRAWWVLRGLELLAEMADADTASDYRGIVARLRGFWGGYIAQSNAADVTETEDLEASIQKLFSKLQSGLPGAAYTDPGPAWGLKRQYDKKASVTMAGGQLRHLLNAAWFARSDDVTDLRKPVQIDKWVREFARSAPL